MIYIMYIFFSISVLKIRGVKFIRFPLNQVSGLKQQQQLQKKLCYLIQ